MWKKPSVEKPSFNKINLEDMSVKESIDTNGGAIGSTVEDIIKLPPMKWPPVILTGLVAPKYPIDIGQISVIKGI